MVKSLRFLAGTLATSLCVFGLVAGPASATSTAADCEDLSLVAILHVTPEVEFEGTTGDDIICGTAGDDVINGGGGNDIIYGLDGNDTIRSGDGDDEIDAGNGNDIVFAEADDDNVDGEAGNDEINLGDGDDYAEGGSGADKLWGGDGSDSLIGESGNDWVSGGDGDDTIKLDAGDDYALGGPGADLLFGGKGEDALNAGTGSDSLDGGSGADSVNGGTQEGNDKDYCAKDKLDTQKNCFYDSKGPRLISVAVISGARIDTSESGQIVTIRARVKDSSGVATIGLGFSRLDKKGLPVGSGLSFGYFATGGGGCDSNGPVALDFDGANTGCRISGTYSDGIYEFKTVVPKYKVPGTYVFISAGLTDLAGNKTEVLQKTIKAKKMAINFKQIGAGDGTGPTLSSISLLTKSVNTASAPQVVTVRAAVKDGLSGVVQVDLIFYRIVKGKATSPTIFRFTDGSIDVNNCVGGHAPDPTGLDSPTGCRVSGNPNSQVLEMKILLPRYSVRGSYHLDNIIMTDKANNQSRMYLEDLKRKKLAVNFKQVDAGDSSGPTLKKVTVLTPKIDSGASAQIVTMRVQVRDNNSGVKNFSIEFGRIKSGVSNPVDTDISAHWYENYDDSKDNVQILIPEGACNPSKTHAKDPDISIWGASGTACRISGTARDGVYEVKVIVPAHAAAGSYKLDSFRASDHASNESSLGWYQLKKNELNIGFKNG